jgi:GNAT superfamily N-acetyltransferase
VLTVRKAKRSDIPVLKALWSELAEHHERLAEGRDLAIYLPRRSEGERRFTSAVRKNIGSKNGVIFLAHFGDSAAGYAMILIRPSPFNSLVARFGFIDHLLVAKAFRARGISSALYREALAWFRRKGIRHLSLTVMDGNAEPQAIYRKWGFFPFVIEMRKDLKPHADAKTADVKTARGKSKPAANHSTR